MSRKGSAPTLAVIATVLAVGITGCSAPQAAPVPADVPVSAPTASPTPELEPLGSLTGTVLIRLDNRHGGVIYGPYKRVSDRIAVDFNCLGPGTVTVTIVGVGNFPNQCGLDGSSVRNILDVHLVDSFVVRVDGPSEVEWSLGISEIP